MKNGIYWNKSIKAQVKRILILMSVLFVLLCLFINSSMQKLLLYNANEHTTITAQKLENQLDFIYDKMDTFSLSIVDQEVVQQLMSAEFSDKARLVRPVEEMIAYYKILDPSIVDISLVNDEMYYSSIYSHEDLDELRSMNGNTLFSWLGVRKSGFINYPEKQSMLLYGREIIEKGVDVGTLIISIDSNYFQISLGEEMNSYFLLANADGVIFSFNSTADTAERIWKAWMDGERAAGRKVDSQQPYFLQSVYSENMGCYQLSALDIRQTNRNLGSIHNLIWGCIILVVVFLLLLLGVINIQVVKPLHHFHGVIRQIRSQKRGSLKEELDLGGCSEIQEIGEEFSGMLQDIDQLNRKIFDTATDLYEVKLQKQQAELSWLKSQIDPHFLYNTLEIFRKMALEKNAPEIAQMSVDMGKIFRYSSKGESMVMLAEELSIIKSYIHIQKTRFQGKIEVFYFLPEETLKVQVMKMLLQPIVENAIFHGLEPKDGKGSLFIGARIEKSVLVITVKDDGVGIEAERLAEINRRLEAEKYDTSRHVGILNTQSRIRLQYGKQFGITVESRAEDGTTVTMKVPANQEGEGKNV